MAAVQPGALAPGPDVTNKQTKPVTKFKQYMKNTQKAITIKLQ
jgi:hypothetical protein